MHIRFPRSRGPGSRAGTFFGLLMLLAVLVVMFMVFTAASNYGSGYWPFGGRSASADGISTGSGNGAGVVTVVSEISDFSAPDSDALGPPAETPPLEIVPHHATSSGARPGNPSDAGATGTHMSSDAVPYGFPTREHPAIISIPAHGSGWSAGVALPLPTAGGIAYALCRSAELENDTLLVQYRRSTGGWHDFVPGADGREERYQSAAAAQEVTYFFVPAGEPCKGDSVG